MTVTKFLARDCVFELETATDEWVQVKGLNSWTHAPQSTDADTTTFDENGRQSHLKASRGDQFTLAGLALEDPDTAAQDPGQEAVEAWADEIGTDSIKRFRITTAAGRVIGPFNASATVTRGGGDKNAPSSWTAAIVVSGPLNPNSGAVPAVPTAVSGSENLPTSSVLSFTTSTGSPDLFEVVIYIDDVELKRVRSTEKPILVSGLTDGESYTAKARAHNAHGWSALSAESAAFIVND